MKKIYLFFFLFCSVSTFALHTTFTSSIYVGDVIGYGPLHNANIPTTTRRVRFINRIDTCPQVEMALTTAEYIFSNDMKTNGIDLITIEAEVFMGNASDLEQDELCKVIVKYTDTIATNIYYPMISQYYYSDIPVLLPMTLYNQIKGFSQGPSMQIILNPNFSYHFETSEVPSGKIDAISIFLRALAIGCGIQSSLNPNSMQFGVSLNGQTYIHAFDAHIYNDSNRTYRDVVTGNISAATFLGGRTLYADGLDEYGTPSISLFNDWEYGVMGFNVTSKTLNTIDADNTYTDDELNDGFYDLLDPNWSYDMEQRNITPYTMALLRGLGWKKDIPVGYNDFANVYNSTLCCSSTILQPNQTYHVWLSQNAILSNVVCKLQGKDSAYVIASDNSSGYLSYNSIPNNVQWKRNPITKNIIGQLHAKASAYNNGIYVEVEKILDVEIPYKPNKPIVQKSEETLSGSINLDLSAFANGSNTYTVTYTGVTYGNTHTFTTTKDALDTILTNISGNQLYNLSIYGTNSQGNSDSYNFTFGFSAHPPLNMTVSVMGTTLRYDLSNNGTIDISDVVISSVQITDPAGLVWMTPTAGSGDPINISSLSRGHYIITVIADGNTYSRVFIKR